MSIPRWRAIIGIVGILTLVATSANAAPTMRIPRVFSDGFVDILNVGDSVTGSANDAYRAQATQDMTAAGIASRWYVHGVSGAPCSDLATSFSTWLNDAKPDVVLIYCGINDARLGLPRTQTHDALKSMAQAAVNFVPRPAIYFGSLSYANPVATGIARTDAEANVNNAIMDVTTIDFPYTTASINFTVVPGETPFKVEDGVHMTALGNKVMGRVITNSSYFWSAIGGIGSPPPLFCGMLGRWHGNPQPNNPPCTSMS